jgi:hypothetical protein
LEVGKTFTVFQLVTILELIIGIRDDDEAIYCEQNHAAGCFRWDFHRQEIQFMAVLIFFLVIHQIYHQPNFKLNKSY